MKESKGRKEGLERRIEEPKRRKEVEGTDRRARATDERVEGTERRSRATDRRAEATERGRSDGLKSIRNSSDATEKCPVGSEI